MKYLKKYILFEKNDYWKIELQDAVAAEYRDYEINTEFELEIITQNLLDRLNININKNDFKNAMSIVSSYIIDNIDDWKDEIEILLKKTNIIKKIL